MKILKLLLMLFFLIGTIISLVGMFVVDPGFGMSGWTFLLLPCFLLCAPMTFNFWREWRNET